MCSAEFGDIFLFIIFKRNIELLFWSTVFHSPCVPLVCTLLSLRLQSWGEKKLISRIEVRIMLWTNIYSEFFFFFFTSRKQLSCHLAHFRARPLGCFATFPSPVGASVTLCCHVWPGWSLSHQTGISFKTCTVFLVSVFSLPRTVLPKSVEWTRDGIMCFYTERNWKTCLHKDWRKYGTMVKWKEDPGNSDRKFREFF